MPDNGQAETLLAAAALERLIPTFERFAMEDWRGAEEQKRYVEMLVMIRDGLPIPASPPLMEAHHG